MAVANDALDPGEYGSVEERLAAHKEQQFWAAETARRTAESERVRSERGSEMYKLTYLLLEELRAVRKLLERDASTP